MSKLNYAYGQFTDWQDGRDSFKDDLAWTDFWLQAVSITVQFVAYPLLQLGYREGLSQVQEINKKKAAKTNSDADKKIRTFAEEKFVDNNAI